VFCHYFVVFGEGKGERSMDDVPLPVATGIGPFQSGFARLRELGLGALASDLERITAGRLDPRRHGDLPRWWRVVSSLPESLVAAADGGGDRVSGADNGTVALDRACIGVERDPPLSDPERARLRGLLLELHPWRKGPFCLHGVHVESEWRSDWKWDRLSSHISDLRGRLLLDVGCGNGYHCWRMAGRGARLVLGIDPAPLYNMQFLAVSRLLGVPGVAMLPLALEELPAAATGFDGVFSMGVLYHRRSPLDHLARLRRVLRVGGELVLETLILEGDEDRVLAPTGRYARMPNVWFIPTQGVLISWLRRSGFRGARLVDVTRTGVAEQRTTAWMRFESLRACLDPDDSARTVEGYPAPCRGIFVAEAGSGSAARGTP
jgi:tRNA (mo5U34)-methyltransferase